MFGKWWSNPYAWALDKICELRDRALKDDREAIEQLRTMTMLMAAKLDYDEPRDRALTNKTVDQLAATAMLMAAELDHDQLQDLFQDAMADDGYFEAQQEAEKAVANRSMSKLLAWTCPRCGAHNLDPPSLDAPRCVECGVKQGLVG